MTIPISVELDIPHFKESHRLYITLGMNGSEIHKASKIKGNHVINIEHFPLLPNSRNTLTINVAGFQKDWNEDPFDKPILHSLERFHIPSIFQDKLSL